MKTRIGFLVLIAAIATGCGEAENTTTPDRPAAPSDSATTETITPETPVAADSAGSASDPIDPPSAVPPEPPDGDADGVPDEFDACADTPAGTVVDADGCRERLQAAREFQLDVAFATGSTNIDALGDVEEIVELLERFPETTLRVEGHTDSVGSEAANLALSERRAESVAEAIRDRFGIAADRISAQGFGETRPVADNDTDSGRAANRRVVVVVEPAA